jgi:hypothetical protein
MAAYEQAKRVLEWKLFRCHPDRILIAFVPDV